MSFEAHRAAAQTSDAIQRDLEAQLRVVDASMRSAVKSERARIVEIVKAVRSTKTHHQMSLNVCDEILRRIGE